MEYKRWSNLTKLIQLVVMSLATLYSFPTAIRYPKPNVFFFSPAATLARIATRISEERGLFVGQFLLILVLKSYRFGILRRCGEKLKIAVNFMDDDNVEIGWDKISGNMLYIVLKNKYTVSRNNKKNIQIGAAQSHLGRPDVDIFISYLNM